MKLEWEMRVKEQTFKIIIIINFLFFSKVFSNEIILEYESIKDDLKTESITETENYFFATSFSKLSSIEKNDYEKNKISANSKFINYLNESVNWPNKIPKYLRKSLWVFYINEKKYEFEKSQVVDQGKIGQYFFIVVGLPKTELINNRVTYEQILSNLKK